MTDRLTHLLRSYAPEAPPSSKDVADRIVLLATQKSHHQPGSENRMHLAFLPLAAAIAAFIMSPSRHSPDAWEETADFAEAVVLDVMQLDMEYDGDLYGMLEY